MPEVRIHEAAAQELQEAATWYEKEAPGTGARLVDAFENAISLHRDEPVPLAATSGQANVHGAKRLLLLRFPFDVVIVEETDELIVVAVAHQARQPSCWINRLDP
jgi:toxin ParE1/3/4